MLKSLIDKPQSFWDNVLLTDETKAELFGDAEHQFVNRWENEAHKGKNIRPTVKHGRDSIMLWACFAASGTGGTDCNKGAMKSDYQGILEQNL